METPRYPNSCPNCIYAGAWCEYDNYYCENHYGRTSVSVVVWAESESCMNIKSYKKKDISPAWGPAFEVQKNPFIHLVRQIVDNSEKS